MVEVIVTTVVPAEVHHVGSGGGGISIEPAHTEMHRLQFEDYAHAQAYLVTGRHGIDVRDDVEGKGPGDTKCVSFEKLVGEIE